MNLPGQYAYITRKKNENNKIYRVKELIRGSEIEVCFLKIAIDIFHY